MHGYELLELVPELTQNDRVDVGGLYRVLRALEDESLVTSVWNAELPGPAKRTYTLTDSGCRLLDQWAEALRETERVVAAFLARYEDERG